MIDEAPGLALRAACGSLSRSARLLIDDVTERPAIVTSHFKNHQSAIVNQLVEGTARITQVVTAQLPLPSD